MKCYSVKYEHCMDLLVVIRSFWSCIWAWHLYLLFLRNSSTHEIFIGKSINKVYVAVKKSFSHSLHSSDFPVTTFYNKCLCSYHLLIFRYVIVKSLMFTDYGNAHPQIKWETLFFILITNQTHWLFKFILLENSTCFGHLLCPSSGFFYCTFGTGKFLAGLMTASKKSQDGTVVPPWLCLETVVKPAWKLPVPNVQ